MKDYNVKVKLYIESDYIVNAIDKVNAEEKVSDVIEKLNLSKLGIVKVDLEVKDYDD